MAQVKITSFVGKSPTFEAMKFDVKDIRTTSKRRKVKGSEEREPYTAVLFVTESGQVRSLAEDSLGNIRLPEEPGSPTLGELFDGLDLTLPVMGRIESSAIPGLDSKTLQSNSKRPWQIHQCDWYGVKKADFRPVGS